MASGYHKLRLLTRNPSTIGFVRTLELTKPKNKPDEIHPHYHIILAVNTRYFKENYWSKSRWIDEWRKAMNLDYDPSVFIQKIKGETDADLFDAVLETVKYQIKTDDIFDDEAWFKTVFLQMTKKRKYASGGILKDIMKKIKAIKIDHDDISDDAIDHCSNDLLFDFSTKEKSYLRREKKDDL